ncbi:hypothetical protein HZS_6955 [Henneguya salminicola]|nr:hypothetical protein HZS_6955 [Henneguya salminicola]
MINNFAAKKESITIAVEGNISSGKTTFLEYFKSKKPQINVIPEPWPQWRDVKGYNLMDMYYENTTKWALAFQTNLITQMIVDLQNNLLRERIHPLEHIVLKNLVNCFEQSNCYKVDEIIYLRSSPEACMRRMTGKEFLMTTFPIEKLRLLHDLYEQTFVERKERFSMPVIEVNVIDELDEMKKIYDKLIERLSKKHKNIFG